MNPDLALAFGAALLCAAVAIIDPVTQWRRWRRRSGERPEAPRAPACSCPMSLRDVGEHSIACGAEG